MQVLVISSYPDRAEVHGKKTVGVASYTKNTLLAATKADSTLEFKVLAEIFDKPEEYKDTQNISVQRIWQRNSIKSYLSLTREIVSYKGKNVFVPFEMFMMGNLMHSVCFAFWLYIPFLMQKHITLVLHQVVGDVSAFEKNPFKKKFYKLTASLFYKLLTTPAKNVIVFEQELKNRLGDSNKVYVVPHAVENLNAINRIEACTEVGLDVEKKYLLYFGFIAPYKGLDDLLKIIDLPKGYQLIIAGGENPNHSNNPEYQKFVKDIKRMAKDKNAQITGFLPEEQIKYYFSAADVVILPYKTFMSSSGPLSFAIAYEIPFLFSQPLSVYFETDDMKSSAVKFGINKEESTFAFDADDLNQKFIAISNESKFKEFSKELKAKRSWQKIGEVYANFLRSEK